MINQLSIIDNKRSEIKMTERPRRGNAGRLMQQALADCMFIQRLKIFKLHFGQPYYLNIRSRDNFRAIL